MTYIDTFNAAIVKNGKSIDCFLDLMPPISLRKLLMYRATGTNTRY